MNVSELKPCPFCGGTPVKRRSSGDERDGYADRVSYACPSCGCSQGAIGDTSKGGYADNSKVESQALARWNTRAPANTCPGHGRSECVSCCWPKGELEGKRADRMVFDEKSRIGELANLLTLAKAHVPITDPLRGLINANLMQHLVEQDPWADFKDAAPVPAGYTAVDMGTAAADGYREGKANPELQMAHVVRALEKVRGGPVLTSNQCYDLARALNGIQRDRVQS